jgi:polyphosphate kinase 2 (PPK2 family)
MGDLDECKRWDDYIAAFEDVLERTATDWAPWYLIPANRKWFRNLAVATIVADTLDDLEPAFPQPDDLPANLEID